MTPNALRLQADSMKGALNRQPGERHWRGSPSVHWQYR